MKEDCWVNTLVPSWTIINWWTDLVVSPILTSTKDLDESKMFLSKVRNAVETPAVVVVNPVSYVADLSAPIGCVGSLYLNVPTPTAVVPNPTVLVLRTTSSAESLRYVRLTIPEFTVAPKEPIKLLEPEIAVVSK